MNKNGQLLARVNQRVDSETLSQNENPRTVVHTDLDIPSKGVHKSIVNQLSQKDQDIQNSKRRAPNLDSYDYPNNNVSKESSQSWIEHTEHLRFNRPCHKTF